MTEADFYFEFNNTISRAYKINLYFLDINNTPVYTIPFNVPAYTGAVNLVNKTVIFQNATLVQLKNTRRIGFTVTMLPGTPLTTSSLGSLKMLSSTTVYLSLQ